MSIRLPKKSLPKRVKPAPTRVTNLFNMEFSPKRLGNGYFSVTLRAWQDFSEVVNAKGLRRTTLLYRGHICDGWSLEPSLYRNVNKSDSERAEELAKRHLCDFKMAARGRCRLDDKLSDIEWWALGQHMGLKTPFLDWSISPYVALFFAFAGVDDSLDTDVRSVYVLDRNLIEKRCNELQKEYDQPEWLIKFVSPFSHDNARIVGQSGLFTLTPPLWTIEEWVNDEFDKTPDKMALIKILIPTDASNRRDCLRHLNRMNINYLSLYPDLEGTTRHCNLKREISAY